MVELRKKLENAMNIHAAANDAEEPSQSHNRDMAKEIPLRILMAEDNTVNQKVSRLILSRYGYTADIVNTGSQALERVKRQHYDVILMDIQMPEMDGYTATRYIRQLNSKGHRPYIIALTAGAMLGDREAAIEAGMDDYLSKPVKQEELRDALLRANAQKD